MKSSFSAVSKPTFASECSFCNFPPPRIAVERQSACFEIYTEIYTPHRNQNATQIRQSFRQTASRNLRSFLPLPGAHGGGLHRTRRGEVAPERARPRQRLQHRHGPVIFLEVNFCKLQLNFWWACVRICSAISEFFFGNSVSKKKGASLRARDMPLGRAGCGSAGSAGGLLRHAGLLIWGVRADSTGRCVFCSGHLPTAFSF